jgi:hypothetical protein
MPTLYVIDTYTLLALLAAASCTALAAAILRSRKDRTVGVLFLLQQTNHPSPYRS